jgi:hypothetical protein
MPLGHHDFVPTIEDHVYEVCVINSGRLAPPPQRRESSGFTTFGKDTVLDGCAKRITQG